MMSTATGWGTTSSGGSASRFLMQVTMPWYAQFRIKKTSISEYLIKKTSNRLTDAACIQKYSINPAIIICAGDTGGNKDTCQVNY